MGKANLPTVAEAIELLGYWRTPTDDKRRVQAANVLADAHLETVDRTSLRARIAALEARLAEEAREKKALPSAAQMGIMREALEKSACECMEKPWVRDHSLCPRCAALAACREAMGETP